MTEEPMHPAVRAYLDAHGNVTRNTPRAVQQIRNVRALVRKLDEEHTDMAVRATRDGNMAAKLRADELARIIQRIEACLRVRP